MSPLGEEQERLLFSAEGLETRLPESDPRLAGVIRRNLHFHFVSRNNPDKIFPHFAGDVRKHDMVIRQLHPEHRPG